MIFCGVLSEFSQAQPFTLQPGAFPVQSFSDIKWCDFDHDGDLDYLIFQRIGTFPAISIKVFENLGKSVFSEVASIPSAEGGSSVSWLDFDNDGDMDILHVSGGNVANGVEIFRNNGAKVFSKITDSFIDEYDGNNAVGDLNNDGYPDILYNGHITNKTYIYLNNKNSTFTRLVNHPIIGLCYGSFDLADFDGNGYPDILISGTAYLEMNDYTRVYKNNGNNTFSEIAFRFTGVSNGAGMRGTCCRWVDYDRDGDQDVILVGNEFIYLYRNIGNSSFEKKDSISVPNLDEGSVSLGDYDGDGDPDILVSGRRSISTSTYKTSKVFKNNGGGHFVEEPNISLSDQVYGITQWVDYDGDGDLDIVLNGLLYRNDRLMNSINNQVSGGNIKLYPNPAHDFLFLGGGPKRCEITISDITGKAYPVISTKHGQTKINIAHLGKGLYVAQINDGTGIRTEKFVKN